MATINGTAGNDVLQAAAGGDSLFGDAGNDVLIGNTGNDTLNGGTGDDSLIGGAGDDSYIVDSVNDTVTEAAGAGTDIVASSVSFTLGANVENLTAAGTAGIALTGNTIANVIRGNAGANAIFGGGDDTTAFAAADTLVGGAGDDTYTIGDGANDLVVEAADNAVAGTVGGTDTLLVVASLNRTGYDLRTSGTAFSAAGALSGVGGSAVENIIASNAASTIALDLAGSTTAQTIVGNAGINRIDDGGVGDADTLIGFAGDDTYVVNNVGTVVVEDAGNGVDTVVIASNPAPASGVNTFTFTGSVETITANGGTGFGGAAIAAATGALNITGGTASQTIIGNGAANALVGGGGTDTLIGGAGNDTYTVDSLDDVVDETTNGGNGVDRVIASSSFALNTTAGVEYLIAAGTNLATLTGQGDGTNSLNALNTTVTSNYFVGNATTAERIFGDAGGNILNGFRNNGDETTTAATIAANGADTLFGGAGNDTYRVYDQTDVVVEDSNGGVQDFIYTNVSYSLVANDANAQAATFQTNTGAGRSVGGTFINAPMQIEVLSAADQNLGTAGTASITLTGNEQGQIIIGNFGDNTLVDNGGGTAITGSQDQLAGLRGNDTYTVTAQNTTVNENVGEGTDIVNVTLAAGGFFTLIDAAEVEYLNAGGTAAFNLRGNQFNQVITGNAGNNTLDGNGGQDTLVGGAGNDTYVITAANAANVSIIEATAAVGAGNGDGDIVSTSVTFDLGATNVSYTNSAGAVVAAAGTIGIEQIIVTNGQSTDNINLTGNGAAQILVGNYGNNILDGDNDTRAGGAGTALTGTPAGDTLTGLLGNDTYRVYSQNDIVRENGGEGNDVVFTSANYQLRAGNSVETLSAASQLSTTGLVLTGNEFAQTVIGTAGNDTIWGGAGNDTLIGGAGSDTFGFGEVGTANADVLQDFTAGDFIGLSSTAFQTSGAGGAGFLGGNGTLEAGEFVVGTAAVDNNDFIVYNQTTGQLFFDADGNGAGAAVLFATLVPGTALGFNDFAPLGAAPATIAGA